MAASGTDAASSTVHQIARQPLAVRARSVADDLADEHAVVDDGDASGLGGGVERED